MNLDEAVAALVSDIDYWAAMRHYGLLWAKATEEGRDVEAINDAAIVVEQAKIAKLLGHEPTREEIAVFDAATEKMWELLCNEWVSR